MSVPALRNENLQSSETHLLDVLLELGKAGIDKLLLACVKVTKRVDLVNTVFAEGDLGSKEVDALVFEKR